MSFANAEIIAVGSELLTASKTDTNSLWLTDQLNTLGVEVVLKSIVGDDRARLSEVIRAALSRSEIVILTGGLGPTEDDVTRDAVATACGRTLIYSQDLENAIAARFRRMNRPMAEINKRQAFLVEGAEALPNGRGTAAGQWLEIEGRIVILLPGPPREMETMFGLECLPRLERRLPPAVIRTRFYRIACIGESDLDALIAPVYTRYTNPVTTILAGPADIQIHLRARAASAEEAESLVVELGSQIESVLGTRLYTSTGDPLEAVVGALLAGRGETLALAESLTGGMIGERITSVPKSSRYFSGGLCTYTDEAKAALLGVPEALLAEHTAVSDPVARAMAAGASERFGSTWGLAVTGYAGPDEEAGKTGTVYIGVAGPDRMKSTMVQFSGDRSRIRRLTVMWALEFLRQELLLP